MGTSFPIETMAEIFQTGDEFSCLEYDVEGSIRLGDGAHWKDEHWVWFEEGHLLDARCPVCTSDRKCRQQLMLYPLRGHLVVVHDTEDVASEGDA